LAARGPGFGARGADGTAGGGVVVAAVGVTV
jgi:hypothetical protein